MNEMKILFVIDSPHKAGYGHISRCTTLATYFKELGFNTFMLIDDRSEKTLDKGNNEIVFDFETAPREKFNFVVVDFYNYPIERIKIIKSLVQCPVGEIVDSMNNSTGITDFIIYQNPIGKLDIMPKCKIYTGIQYQIIQDKFLNLTKKIFDQRMNKQEGHIYLSSGGIDSKNINMQVLQFLEELNVKESVVVATTSKSPHLEMLVKFKNTAQLNVRIEVDNTQQEKLIEGAIIGIGAAGMNMHERCSMLLPSIIYQSAENQRNNYDFARRNELGEPCSFDGKTLAKSEFKSGVLNLLNNKSKYKEIVQNNFKIYSKISPKNIAISIVNDFSVLKTD